MKSEFYKFNKNKIPLISVVLPVYNVERYIEECLKSVLNQTIQDFEIIIIDDKSTDKTVSIIERINDNRIRLIKKKQNKGLIDSLNLGFSLAEGKYIARVDGDDINVLDRFEKQLSILEKSPEIKVCGCWLKTFGESEEIIKHKEFHDDIAANMLLHCSMSMGAVMFERQELGNYRFDMNKLHVEDYDFWSRTLWICKFYNIQEVLYYYRKHANQVSTIYNSIQVKSDIAIKLFLFKKIGYSTTKFPDDLITKMLLLDSYITINELSIFLNWINDLKRLNKEQNIFEHKYLVEVLKKMKEKTLNKLYFSNSIPGITKKWRLLVLFQLNFSDIKNVLSRKIIEFKRIKFSSI